MNKCIFVVITIMAYTIVFAEPLLPVKYGLVKGDKVIIRSGP